MTLCLCSGWYRDFDEYPDSFSEIILFLVNVLERFLIGLLLEKVKMSVLINMADIGILMRPFFQINPLLAIKALA